MLQIKASVKSGSYSFFCIFSAIKTIYNNMKDTKKNLCFLSALFIFSLVSSIAQFYPHDKNIDYRENFRGQYHFSPRSGWMNDINGLVYFGGKYHMIYQWGKAIRHGGYATSTDLFHWKDKGVALIPQKSFLPSEAVRNVSGDQVFSGSAVIVSGKTAKKITGSPDEAIVAIYTGTAVGTCLAWSNDNGKTWHDYHDNPVANKTDNAYPRDPCVIWHEPTSKWVMALYENGTTFYGSSDLINWEYLSNIDFGYECPDLYQLPVDGKYKKWVLQDANGSYLVGKFDGNIFTMDKGQDTLVMDKGPDFYAAQTFPSGNLPNNDKRTIQIAWMDHWNGGVGETVWERNATFPVFIELTEYNGKIMMKRNPVDEIAELYTNSIKWGNKIVQPGKNLLSNVRSKKFDLTAEFDLKGTNATKVGFKVANKEIEYDISKNTLLSAKVGYSEGEKLKIRLLVDHGQLEVFANDGIYSWTEQFAFTPERNYIELHSDGKIKLIKMEFHEIARIW